MTDDCSHCWHPQSSSIGSDGKMTRSWTEERCCWCGQFRTMEHTFETLPPKQHGRFVAAWRYMQGGSHD